MITGQHDRFKDAPWYGGLPITVIGAGGIGSWTSLLLSRMGHDLYVYDDDVIEAANIGGQFYGPDNVGFNKVEALSQHLHTISGPTSITEMGRFEQGSPISDIVILALDNMHYRKIAAEQWYDLQMAKKAAGTDTTGQINLLIDGRMEAETAIIYSVDRPSKFRKWTDEWFPDENVPDAPCSFRATSHNASLIASIIVSLLNNKITNVREGADYREVPYKVRYNLHLIDFDVEV